jgi:hypothetical protein
MSEPPAEPVVVSRAAADVLRALLRLDPAAVRKVRERARKRTRPRRQQGPTADYGN